MHWQNNNGMGFLCSKQNISSRPRNIWRETYKYLPHQYFQEGNALLIHFPSIYTYIKQRHLPFLMSRTVVIPFHRAPTSSGVVALTNNYLFTAFSHLLPDTGLSWTKYLSLCERRPSFYFFSDSNSIHHLRSGNHEIPLAFTHQHKGLSFSFPPTSTSYHGRPVSWSLQSGTYCLPQKMN